jgi:hypothetical protein
MLVKGGKLDRTYQITVPRALDDDGRVGLIATFQETNITFSAGRTVLSTVAADLMAAPISLRSIRAACVPALEGAEDVPLRAHRSNRPSD